MSKWKNFGDVNFSEYGGILTRKCEDRQEDVSFFQLIVNESVRYAFYGTVVNVMDYKDEQCIKEMAEIYKYKSSTDYILNDPESAVVDLLNKYGDMNFSAVNKDGKCAYSMDINDFALTEQELDTFMKDLNIPEEFRPVFNIHVISYYGSDYRGIEDTFHTNYWEDIKSYCHEKLMKGFNVEIEDDRDGKSVRLDSERYIDTFESRNGEFPVDEQYMEVDYGIEDKEF